MIVIKTECFRCGEITIPLTEIELHVNTGSEVPYFTYECPECGEVRGGEADERFADFLVANGIIPDEERFAPEILELHEGGAIDYDDILDAHLLLQRDDWEQDLEDSFEVA